MLYFVMFSIFFFCRKITAKSLTFPCSFLFFSRYCKRQSDKQTADAPNVTLFSTGNVNRFSCNLKFIGHGIRAGDSPSARTVDCLTLFAIGNDTLSANFYRCDILGVLAAGDLINFGNQTTFRDCNISGCGTTSTTNALIRARTGNVGVVIDRLIMLDYGNHNGEYVSKTNNPASGEFNRVWTNKGYWIQVDQPGAVIGTSYVEIVVTNSRFDEGSPGALLADGGTELVNLLWQGNTVNVGFNFINTTNTPINARALKLNKVRGEIINSWAGLANPAETADLPWLEATNSNLVIRGRGKTASVNRKVKDAATIIKET